MLGNFQQSELRIEVEASAKVIGDSLLCPANLKQWLWFERFEPGMPEKLESGLKFTSWAGFVAVTHQVEVVNTNYLRLILSQGIDGYHEWCWGDGWLQSRLEGISLLPLNLGQTMSLLRLRQFVKATEQAVKV